MKKKIKLRGELVLIMLVSLVISFIIVFWMQAHGIRFDKNTMTGRKEKLYEEVINDAVADLRSCDLENKEALRVHLEEKYGYLIGYELYIVDEEGNVLAGTNESIQKVAKDKIISGKCEYSCDPVDENVFRMAGSEYLKENAYLYYSYLLYGQNDTGVVISGLIGALICFFVLVWGRISYISEIKKSVSAIAKGDLNYRVPCKYKNELRELAEGINYMAEELASEEQKRNEFLTNISHDIRTPLTTILGYLDMVKKKKYDSEEEFEKYIEIMERKGGFLANMLEDFFQYTKLASGDIKLEPMPFELNELLRQFYEDEEEAFLAKGMNLQLVLSDTAIKCQGDIELLARVVNNLLSNALKYAKIGTKVEISSEVCQCDGKTYGAFSVSNVPKEEIDSTELTRLFERLYKKDHARNGEGSGLGLSIAKNIIDLHQGQLQAALIDERIVFKVMLPIRKIEMSK